MFSSASQSRREGCSCGAVITAAELGWFGELSLPTPEWALGAGGWDLLRRLEEVKRENKGC